MYVSEILTNLKHEGKPGNYALWRHTVIVGPNESHKSAITQSLELLYYGEATGLFFKDAAKMGKHINLMGETPINIRGKIDDAGQAGYPAWTDYTLNDKGTAKQKGLGAEAGYSYQAVKAALASPGSILMWIARMKSEWVNMQMPAALLYEGLSTADQEVLCRLTTSGPLGQPPSSIPVHIALSSINLCNDQVKQLKAQLKEAEAALAAVGAETPVSAEETMMADGKLAIAVEGEFIRKMVQMGLIRDDQRAAIIGLAGGKEAIIAAGKVDRAFLEFRNQVIRDNYRSMRLKYQDTIASLKLLIAQYDFLPKLVSNLEQFISEKIVPHFCTAVNKYLGWADQFDISADNRPGLYRNGKLHTALSGSTEVRVVLAVQAVMAELFSPPVMLGAVEDRQWDADTLAETLCALKDAPQQIVITSTVHPTDAHGWRVIELPKAEWSELR